MASYEWIGGTSTDASTASNWSPATVPTSVDTAIFNSKATAACVWNISAVDIIQIDSDFLFILEIASNVALRGLSIGVTGQIDATNPYILTFSGTPPYNSNKSHIVMNYDSDNSPFRTASARTYITYTMNGSSQITYDSGIYPQIILANGSHTPDYIATSNTKKDQVKFLSLTVNSGVTFQPASTTPTTNDRNKKWISDFAGQTQFATNNTNFNGGYAEWTFQAMTSGFTMPTSGSPTFNGCVFTFHKIVLDASVDGAGAWAKITQATRLQLNDLTINTGASLKGGSDSIGCAILLINRPTIRGTWGFIPVADGIYVYPKTGETLGVADGGTGIKSVAEGNVLFGSQPNQLSSSVNFNYDSANELLEVGKLKSHIIIQIENDTASTISKGQAVYVSGEGTHPAVSPAQADSESTMASIGLVLEQIAGSASGYACVNGLITVSSSIIDDTLTDPTDVGKTLYVSPTTAGNLTITRPTSATHLIQNVGHIADISGSNVKIIVSNIGRTNDVPNTINAVDGNFTGDFDITGKLTVGGLIDPTGLELTPVSANPGNVTANTLWLDSTDSNKLKIGTTDISSGGGGGSGTVTSVAVSGSDGIEVDSGSPITTSGTIALGVDAPTLRSHINVEDGADVTDATNVASAGAIMDSDFSANGLMERTGSGSYTSNTTILQRESLSLDYATGWWTFAVIKGRDLVGSSGQRGQAQFYIQDKRSSRHRTCRIEVGHQFGANGSNFINLLGVSGYGNAIAFTDFRIKEGATYDGAALQIYISNASNDIDLHMMFNLGTGNGWTLLGTMLADSDTSGHDALLGYVSGGYVDFATSMAVGKTLDIEETGFVDANDGGGLATTGGLTVDGSARISGTLRQGVVSSLIKSDSNGDLVGATPNVDYVETDATGTYGVWKSTTDYDNKVEATDHLFLTDDTTNFTRTGTLTGFSSGVFTATASTAGTYMVRVQYQFGPASTNPIGEVSGNKYTLQLLAYKNTSTMVGFGRAQINGFWADTHFYSSYIVTLANGDTLENKYKIVDHNASGTQFKLKSGGASNNPATIMEMVKIA